MNRSLLFASALASLLAVVTACSLEVKGDAVVDTVRLVDTVTHVETLVVHDTVTGLGDADVNILFGTQPAAPAVGAPTSTPHRDSTPITPRPAPVPVITAAPSTSLYVMSRQLMVPIPGLVPARVPDNFHEKRGTREHQAVDLMSPKGTPILSVDDGRVLKLFTSVAGGLTIYATDPATRVVYYYAHLDSYRTGLREGELLKQGDVIGYVGNTGDASSGAPHLHFALGELGPDRQWYRTTPLDPKGLFTRQGAPRGN